ncbi:ATP-binding cassette domain-containing protein [Sulfurimonas sp.]|uniref:ATP-binding cassette domain-containing protein n=1 Tax=Sulfurimonas sp. TaxID=2022749 RepID=UPI0025E114F7|nr:ATP-binding cassette domain-containing protein [Sulfurimonas sp.]
MLNIKNLSLSYGDKHIFEELNIEIKENEITAIVGASGIGKSSLFLCINQMIRYEKSYKLKGEILYKGIDLMKESEDNLTKIRKNIIYVSQQPDILPMSIYENLAFIARIHKIKNIDEKINAALEKVYLYDEIKDRLHTDATSLSGGQQQRLILARALLLEPEVLLLDEPTASLNEELSHKIGLMLKEHKSTIIIISHFKSQVKKLTNNVYSL